MASTADVSPTGGTARVYCRVFSSPWLPLSSKNFNMSNNTSGDSRTRRFASTAPYSPSSSTRAARTASTSHNSNPGARFNTRPVISGTARFKRTTARVASSAVSVNTRGSLAHTTATSTPVDSRSNTRTSARTRDSTNAASRGHAPRALAVTSARQFALPVQRRQKRSICRSDSGTPCSPSPALRRRTTAAPARPTLASRVVAVVVAMEDDATRVVVVMAGERH